MIIVSRVVYIPYIKKGNKVKMTVLSSSHMPEKLKLLSVICTIYQIRSSLKEKCFRLMYK